MKDENNPFYGIVYKGPEFFCDRNEETKQLKQYIKDGVNVTLFAMRRLGKTGLIHHVFDSYKKSRKTTCIYIDILSTNSLSEFTNALATAVYNRFPPHQKLGKKSMNMFQRFRPTINFDEFTGTPSLSLTLETSVQKNNTIGTILKYLDQQGIKVVFAIDEFQQVLEYPEKNTEAILRTCIQQLQNTSFIFCGSNQKMMHEIFNSAKRPFFASCTNVNLDCISEYEYHKFIKRKFEDNNRKISDECIDFICNWTKLHTFYTQYFCYILFSQNLKSNTIEDALHVALTIFQLNENTFYQYKNLLTSSQWNLLKAIGKEGKVYHPNAHKFISDHNLKTPSSITRSLDALISKEMIFYNTGVENPYYEVYDKYLLRWLQNRK